jgi:hypothetical protein
MSLAPAFDERLMSEVVGAVNGMMRNRTAAPHLERGGPARRTMLALDGLRRRVDR